ncbi:MAG TPA: mechanosensitive ion channel domain-containing protein [Myxococcota bacterium]|nr:mechanosensitive ion channel domain-containing protein [Myxococcota bacterium]
MSPFRRFLLLLAAALCVACLARGAAADAAADASAAAPAAAQAPAPAPTIPVPEIVSRSETANALIQRLAEQQPEAQLRDDIESQLPATTERLRRQRGRVESVLEGTPTLIGLVDMDNEWRARATRLAAWRIALTSAAKSLDVDRTDLAAERTLWERTRAAAESGALPAATLARVNDTISGLADADRALQKRVKAILELQNEVAEEELTVRDVVDRVEKRQAELSKELWSRDSPPLWSAAAWAAPGDRTTVPQKLEAAIQRRIELLEEFADLSLQRVRLEVFAFVFVLVALLAARGRVLASAKVQTDAALAVPTRIVERPISAAIVVAIITAVWTLSRAPGFLNELEALVLLIPVLRLLPVELYGALRPGLVALSALFVSSSLRGLLAPVPLVERMLLLGEALALVPLMIWLQRPSLAARLRTIGRFGAAVIPVARVALAAALVSLVCNVIGMVQLARLILRGNLVSIYAAVALYALARFLGGVVTALVRSDAARKLRGLRDYGELVRRRILVALQWLAAGIWLVTSLRVFGLEGSVRAAAATLFDAKLEVGTISLSLGNVVAFVLSLWFAALLSRFVRFVLDEDVLPHIALPRGVPAAISTGLHYAILAAGTLIAIGAAGVDLSKFSLLAGALGVGIGFGLQNVVNNFVSGLILLFERPVQTGDIIQMGDLSGEVKRIGIRSSTVRTFDGADVILPNASLISDRVVNWTFSDRTRRIELPIGVAYGSDPDKVLAILLETAKARSDVLSLPEPVALFSAFGSSSLDFTLRVWCRFELAPDVKSALGVAVLDALTRAGIEIPLPQHDITLKVQKPEGV